jgi:hypothetical protein
MATKADFTEDEWKALQKGVTGAGMLASLSDRDFTDSFGEASALAKYLSAQHGANSSALMQEVSAAKSTGFGFGDSPQEVETETFDALGTALAALSAKAPDEVAAYRELVLGAAQRVAEAKGGLADSETAAIARLEAAFATS